MVLTTGCQNSYNTSDSNSGDEDSLDIIDEKTLDIMSYNIRGDKASDGENQWEYRKARVVDLIKKYNPAIIGLQEAKPAQLSYLVEQLADFKKIGGGSRPGEYTVFLYNTEKVEYMSGTGDFIWLSETPNEQSVGWDAKYVRILIYANFKNIETGDNLLILNTHFDHVGEQARRESAKLVVSKIQELANDEPVVLMGDFNATEDSKPYDIITGSGLRNAFYVSKTPHQGPTTRSSGFSVENHSNKKPIDFVFVDNRVKVLNHAFLTESTNGYYPSDHLPVLAEIEVKD